jgi:hypothetical protein
MSKTRKPKYVLKQINNLRLVQSSIARRLGGTRDGVNFLVLTPDHRILEEFEDYDAAIDYMRNTSDFLSSKK